MAGQRQWRDAGRTGCGETDTAALRVLVADPDPVSRLMLATIVEHLGYECLIAADGERAWDLCTSEQPDVVITDWQMPRLDGPGLTARIRAEADTAYTYIIVLTGHAGRVAARDAVLAGADDLIFKPLERGALERQLIVARRLVCTDRRRRRAEDRFAVQHAVTALLARALDVDDTITGVIDIIEAGLRWSSGTYSPVDEPIAWVRDGERVAFPVVADSGVVGVFAFGLGPLADPPEQQLLDAIGDQVGQFIDRHEAERQADRIKQQFFGLISHELRTPLTSVIGFVELLREEDPDPERGQMLAVVARNAQRLLRLVGDLLFASQVEDGIVDLDLHTVELADVVSAAVDAARLGVGAAGLSLRTEVDPTPAITGDADRLGQVVDNLLSNAIKYTPAGGHVSVALRTVGEHALIEVSDTGYGIPADQQPQLFDRFYRGPSAVRRAIPGAGLGLAIVKVIAEAHGGSVSLDSAEGAGSTFRVRLPVAAQPDAGRGGAADRSLPV